MSAPFDRVGDSDTYLDDRGNVVRLDASGQWWEAFSARPLLTQVGSFRTRAAAEQLLTDDPGPDAPVGRPILDWEVGR